MGEEMRKNKQSPAVFAKKPAVVATQVALALMAQFAYAQQQVAERVERVEITGTRLPAVNVNLRNLGPTRNLVLMNGRRLPAGSPRSGAASAAADLNQIPAALIQRVELLTGGASAVYGSDAITGVVNFIMNDRFEGLQIDADRSFYNHKQQNPDGIADVVNGRAATNPSQFHVPDNVGADG